MRPSVLSPGDEQFGSTNLKAGNLFFTYIQNNGIAAGGLDCNLQVEFYHLMHPFFTLQKLKFRLHCPK